MIGEQFFHTSSFSAFFVSHVSLKRGAFYKNDYSFVRFFSAKEMVKTVLLFYFTVLV